MARREKPEQRDAFAAWYTENRNFREISLKLAKPDRTLREWAVQFDWYSRADELDRQAEMARRQDLIDKRREQMEREAKRGEMLQEAGAHYIQYQKIDNSRDAINAVKVGADIARRGLGMPLREETVNIRLLEKMTDDELLAIVAEELSGFVGTGANRAAHSGEAEE